MTALRLSCHCGAVAIEVPQRPEQVVDCNCSLCRRIGALWAHYALGAWAAEGDARVLPPTLLGTVTLSGHPEHTAEYIWGDKTLRTLHCRHCGIVTHWEPLQAEPGARHGVNMRNADPAALQGVRVRRFDGADSWKYLD
ncbi:MAG: hypothetical protein Q8N44_15625 [Rubrivivax sp.]|nr:hypothetical protein [Rubrivivax sp.]